MIKSIIGLLVLFLPLQTYAQVVNFKDIDSVFVKKTDWNINELRDPPLTCTTFEEYGTKEGYIINKEHNIKEIKQLCKELENMPTSKPKVMDVRCKLYFYTSDTIAFTACIDYHTTLLDGCYYKTTPCLRKIIDNMTNKHKEKIFEHKQMRKDADRIISGKDSLINYLKEQMPLILKNNTKDSSATICISCNVDKHGNTVNAYIRQDKGVNKIPSNIINHVKAICKDVIRWNANKERTVFDIITKRIELIKN